MKTILTIFAAAGTLFAGTLVAQAQAMTFDYNYDFAGTDFSQIQNAATVQSDFVKNIAETEYLLNPKVKTKAKFYIILRSASWCGPCRFEMPGISKEYSSVIKKNANVELILISHDRDANAMKSWAAQEKIDFPVTMKPAAGGNFGEKPPPAPGIPFSDLQSERRIAGVGPPEQSFRALVRAHGNEKTEAKKAEIARERGNGFRGNALFLNSPADFRRFHRFAFP